MQRAVNWATNILDGVEFIILTSMIIYLIIKLNKGRSQSLPIVVWI